MPYAVIDLETTGFSPVRGDRIIEVGVVLLDESGRIEDEWATLVDPRRDVGPTHVHGIRASDLVGAPTFGDIAGALIDLLSGRTLVAHNQAFDLRFLQAELAAHGHELHGSYAALCTMLWSKRVFGAAKLADICALLEIEHRNAHSALEDARAAAAVLASLIGTAGHTAEWRSHVVGAGFPLVVRGELAEMRIATRVATSESTAEVAAPSALFDTADRPLWERVTIAGEAHDPGASVYLELLADVLSDGLISAAEYWQLGAIAEVAQLPSHRLPDLHRSYLEAALAEAAADGAVTDSERRELTQIATVLDLPVPDLPALGATVSVASATSTEAPIATKARALVAVGQEPPATGAAFELTPGCRVVFTGTLSRPREEWARAIAEAGFITGSVTKNCAVLVAEDPASQSGKAKTAARHGIPVVTEAEFLPVFESYLASRA
ncbi:hypothetical protein B5M43_002795 [Microbacterium sp. MEC084]|uniref:exonuclease domain-containing protein n=1 Tax=Microbacterium sp. MEC084 TaxID=1963027 RepID=UPI00106F7359|nr:exonuclease domain-containing protein [Microbacterium sp. MEC084]MCD1267777.1 hypothetical protein [Microbacterium sp. MEC084]